MEITTERARTQSFIRRGANNIAAYVQELHVYPGAPHGVMLFPDAPVAKRYARGIEEWIARQLHRP